MENSTKTILVTGASAGIGKSIAKQLIKEGYLVYAAARRIEQMEDLSTMGVKTLQMDITIEADIIRVVDTINKEAGGIDCLINNAGYAIYGAVEDTTIDDARRQFEVNLFGLASLTQKVLPYMRSKKAGTIINMSSMGGKIYTPLGAWYHATKHALEGWSDCLRLELQPFNIHVVIIEPGGIKTEFGDVMTAPMLKRSGKSVYSKLANAIAKSTAEIYAEGNSKASDPQVIADLVSKAVKSSRPKTRYVAGYMAKPVMFLRKILSDRMFDKMIMSQAK